MELIFTLSAIIHTVVFFVLSLDIVKLNPQKSNNINFHNIFKYFRFLFLGIQSKNIAMQALSIIGFLSLATFIYTSAVLLFNK